MRGVEDAAQRAPATATRRSPCSTALANVKVCSAVSQSPNSLLVGKRAMRERRRKGDRRRELDLGRARRASASSSASTIAAGSSPSSVSTSASTAVQPPRRRAAASASGSCREGAARAARPGRPGCARRSPPPSARRRRARRQAGEHRFGALPAGDVERLERLVDEVERVPAVEVAVVGGGREEHVGELCRRRHRRATAETSARSAPSASRTSTNRRNQRASRVGLGRGAGSGSSGKRGGSPAESSATSARPW